jgi:23S rRNA (uracil1939-C5)-methyltransferase
MDTRVVVTVRGIATGGAGVADLPDGRVVFIPRTAPGDRASIRIDKSRPRWAEGSLCELIEPAAERRAALCALYDRCGGCQLQHLPYERQLEWKGRMVVDALTRIGRLERVDVQEVVASPRETGYRSRVTFTLRRLRGGHLVAGFHALDRPAHVIDVAGECVLPRPELVEVWKAMRCRWGQGAALLPAGGRLRLTLRAVEGGVALVVEGGPAQWCADELAAAVPELDAIWHVPTASEGAARLVAGSDYDAARPAFTQVNTEAATLLVEHVLDLAGPAGAAEQTDRTDRARHAVDAYCGDGAYAHGLVESGWRVTGIELDPAACAAARARAEARRLEGFRILQGSVEDRLEEALPADLLIVNPPRAGLDEDVLRAIGEQRPPRVIYVSCDPATLARDVAGLSRAYEPASLRCFDLFPQTAHVEAVLALTSRVG